MAFRVNFTNRRSGRGRAKFFAKISLRGALKTVLEKAAR
jgi:hypothetical protein